MSPRMPKRPFPQDKSIDCLMNSSSHRKIHAYVINGVKSDSGPSLGLCSGDKEEPHSESLSDCYVVILKFDLAFPICPTEIRLPWETCLEQRRNPSESHHLLSYRED